MVNKVTLVGRVGKDPVVKHFDNGGTIAEFNMATDDSYKDKQGNKVEQTDWHNVKVVGKLSEVVEKYVVKGMLLYVEGKLKTRSYEKDGVTKYVTETVVDTLKMLSKRDDALATSSAPSRQPSDAAEHASPANKVIDDLDDMPF